MINFDDTTFENEIENGIANLVRFEEINNEKETQYSEQTLTGFFIKYLTWIGEAEEYIKFHEEVLRKDGPSAPGIIFDSETDNGFDYFAAYYAFKGAFIALFSDKVEEKYSKNLEGLRKVFKNFSYCFESNTPIEVYLEESQIKLSRKELLLIGIPRFLGIKDKDIPAFLLI